MKTSDLTMLSKVALVLAIAGFFVSFSSYSSTSVNGVGTCEFIDYGKIVLGGLTLLVGGFGEFAALRGEGATRMPNLLVSGGASLVGILHLLIGLGIIGGPC